MKVFIVSWVVNPEMIIFIIFIGNSRKTALEIYGVSCCFLHVFQMADQN